jgi:hypothetical protein
MSHTADLTEVLRDLGVEIHKVHNDEINGRCPVHRLSKGRESSRYSWYLNSDSGLWYCFSCGGRGNLSQLVSQLTDDPSALWSIQTHLINSGIQRLTSEEEIEREKEPDVDWSVYAKFLPLPEALRNQRRLSQEASQRYGIRWDTGNKAVVIPIVSPLGELRGWQLKKTGWVRNVPTGVHKSSTLFGIERSVGSTALLLESPLDVVRFHSVVEPNDVSAVATFGANVSDVQIRILADRFDKLIVAMDNDQAGKLETRRLSKVLPSFRGGIRYWKYVDGVKDLGDMTDYQIVSGVDTVASVYV